MVDPVDVLLHTLRLDEPDATVLRDMWPGVRAPGFRGLLAFEACEVWLHRRLRALQIADAPPTALSQWLGKRALGVTAQNMMVDEQTSATVRSLNDLGVPHVMLKGAARRILCEEFPYADARGMCDIDVLVPADLASPTWDAFAGAGFEVAFDPELVPKDHFHLLPIVNDLAVVIEIHSSTSNDIAPAEAWRRQAELGREVETPGGSTLVPTATELFWHGLTHGIRHGEGYFRLRYLLDVASIWASGQEIDWDLMRARLLSDEIENVEIARIWLGAAQWLAGQDYEESPFGTLPQKHLRRLLRWRLALFNRPKLSSRATEKLLEEGVRTEFRLPIAPLYEGTGTVDKARRRTASILARGTYLTWRITSG